MGTMVKITISAKTARALGYRNSIKLPDGQVSWLWSGLILRMTEDNFAKLAAVKQANETPNDTLLRLAEQVN